MDQLEGGYLIHKTNAMLIAQNKHTAGVKGRPISDFDLEATNRIQATPWAVNRRVADVARTMMLDDVASPLVPANGIVQIPGRMSDEVWATMDQAAQKKHKATIAKAHAENASRRGRHNGFMETLDTATEMEAHPAFWFVWTHDFRLRRYPVACGGLSPQGNDLSKSSIMFARGKPLGEGGLYWLCVRLANAMGQDKRPLDERMGWALERVALWEKIAADPIRHREEWENADAPWEALATIFEIVEAVYAPEEFVSHLPVPMDGSCNGLQHLSAMGLDPIGSLATNLCATQDKRHDVYLQVADYAIRRVETDAAKGHPAALLWLGKVGRDTVKRAVLATPYGVTDAGIQRQLIDDRKVPYSDEVSQRDASAYFRDVLVEALSGTVVAAKQIMGWLQASATRLAEASLPMSWETPNGSTITQAYHALSVRRVETLIGSIRLLEEVPGGELSPRDQMLGSAPNVVHSFDAAHLAATVNALGRDHGVADFAMIHDSFGTHACDTPAMHAVLRSTFVEQYQPNQLERLYEGFRAAAPHVDIPAPPALGSFDLAANVPHASFFFA